MIYIRIRKNTLLVREVGDTLDEIATAQFTTSRLLVGEFQIAVAALKTLGVKIKKRHNWWKNPFNSIVIHPLEMSEGGLSEIEQRIYNELVVSSFNGVKKIKIWIGDELNEQELHDIF